MFTVRVSAGVLAVVLLAAGGVFAEEGGWTPLFDGKTLEGWEGNAALFRVEDGAIVGGTLNERIPANHFLCTTKQYGDFELRLKVMVKGEDPNAGIQFRSERVPGGEEVSGYQADLGQQYWGCLYDEARRRKILVQADQEALKEKIHRDSWNDYRIRCEGNHIQLWLNGELTVDYIEEDAGIAQRGIFGLQIHGGKPMEAWYKDIEIRELCAAPAEKKE